MIVPSHLRLIGRSDTAGMPPAIQAPLSIAVAIAAVVALALLASTLVDILGGVVVSVAILVFTHAIMAFAAEPGERAQRPGRPR